MLKLFKRKTTSEDLPTQEETSPPQKGLFSKLKSGLQKTRDNFTSGVGRIFLGKKKIDDELLEALETQLLIADVGVEATREILDKLTALSSRKELKDEHVLFDSLKTALVELLSPVATPLAPTFGETPYIMLVIGVNGAGKTTSIGKLAHQYKAQGKKVMLAAGDTFRAAAIEQLSVWGERNDIPVVAQHTGADSASVIYDAISSATAKNMDMLIADTAGRLHTQSNLMDELKKVKKVIQKINPEAPHETLLVLDAGIGQNALMQAKTFHEALGVTGVALTKMDGTAKGGIIFAIAKQLGLPIRFIGVGEGIEDLRPFEATEFVEALLSDDKLQPSD